jgi:hypothetical protein
LALGTIFVNPLDIPRPAMHDEGMSKKPTKFPTADVLLALWKRPWSSTALRFANHRLTFIRNTMGTDVLEQGR